MLNFIDKIIDDNITMAKLGTDNEYSTALYPNKNAPPTVNTKFSTEIKCLLID